MCGFVEFLFISLWLFILFGGVGHFFQTYFRLNDWYLIKKSTVHHKKWVASQFGSESSSFVLNFGDSPSYLNKELLAYSCVWGINSCGFLFTRKTTEVTRSFQKGFKIIFQTQACAETATAACKWCVVVQGVNGLSLSPCCARQCLSSGGPLSAICCAFMTNLMTGCTKPRPLTPTPTHSLNPAGLNTPSHMPSR